MRSMDLSPLYRSSIGFDRINQVLDAAMRLDDTALSYPPYNIEKLGEDRYRITMAVAGFNPSDLTVTTQDNTVVVAGQPWKEPGKIEYLHRGIAGRAFERRFEIADSIKVTAAALVNGLLHVDLVREVPEAKKPRAIRIETGTSHPQPVLGQVEADKVA